MASSYSLHSLVRAATCKHARGGMIRGRICQVVEGRDGCLPSVRSADGLEVTSWHGENLPAIMKSQGSRAFSRASMFQSIDDGDLLEPLASHLWISLETMGAIGCASVQSWRALGWLMEFAARRDTSGQRRVAVWSEQEHRWFQTHIAEFVLGSAVRPGSPEVLAGVTLASPAP